MSEEKGKKIAVIRIRGMNRLKVAVDDTLSMLNLHRKFYCTIIESNPVVMGMVKKAKDYITWGEIDAETEKELIEKKQEMTKDKEGKDVPKKFFRLHPPRGGFERKGTKIQYRNGGALGDRGAEINKLIKKMI